MCLVSSRKGKSENPQTGLMIELPGKKVGTVKVISTGGDTPETEYSFVEVSTTTTIDTAKLSEYYIEESK